MRVACPSCAAEYDLPEAVAARLGAGKPVRCTRCGTAWTPALPAPPEPPAPAAAVLPERTEPPLDVPPPPRPAPLTPPRPAQEPAAPRRSGPGAGLAWAASLLLLGGAAYAAWHWRTDVVAAWPPAARVYMAFGAGSR